MPQRLSLCLISALLLPLFAVRAQAAEEPGLVKDQPASGRFVKTDRGFMVPYEETIPGTSVVFQMEPIPGGTLKLGSPEGEAKRKADEGPQVEISVAPFWMGRCEVTWAEYKSYMALCDVFKAFAKQNLRQPTKENTQALVSAPSKLYDPSFTYLLGEKPKQPAVTMSQFAARQYTKWLSGITGEFYCLPSEAQWEYAARAGTTTPWFFGADAKQLGDYAWYFENSDSTTHEVGKKKPNPWGLCDIYGNVSEWTLDEYSDAGYKRAAGLKQPLASTDAITWPTILFPRALRGGTYDHDAEQCRSASRLPSNDDAWRARDPNFPLSPWWFTENESVGVGFRIVRPLNPPPADQHARYWDADIDSVREHVEQRVKEEGRGGVGLADPQLPKAMEELKK